MEMVRVLHKWIILNKTKKPSIHSFHTVYTYSGIQKFLYFNNDKFNLFKPVFSTSALGQELYKGEILLTNILQVVFLQSSLDHLGRLILTGQLRKRS